MADQNKGLCILIIEDNPGDQILITELLNASVLKIRLLSKAETLAKATDLLQKEIFDVILLDLSLPDSSGIDTFKAIKKVAGKMPVIILSGLSDMNVAVEAITPGAQDYHTKVDLDDKILTKTILYSIERKHRLENLQGNSDRYVTISKADLDLMQSEEITRQIMKAALDAIIVIDTYGKITVWNSQAEKIFGWKQQEILGKTLSEIVIPTEYREAHEKGMKHYLATGEGPILNKLIEIKALNRDGKHFPVELTITPLTEGGRQYFCAFIRDISERKKAELAIKESEEKYLTLFEQSPVGIYQTTLKGKIITCNDAFAIMLGYSSFADLPEKNSFRFYFSDAERDTSIAELQEKGELINHEIVLRHKDGNTVYLIENCFLRKDTITGEDIIEGMMIDITERKKSAIALRESEEKYRTFFENSMDGILLTAPDGSVLAANPAACNMFIMTEQEICRAGRMGLIDNEDNRLTNLLQQRLQTGKAIGELTFIRKNGSKFPAEISSSIFIDAAGKEKTSMIIRDITERKKNEEALIKSELYLRGTLDSTNDGILAIDNNGKVITTNNRFAELWHIPEELISQKDDRKLLEYVLGQLIDPEAFLSKVRDLYNSDRTGLDMLYFRDDRVFERYSTPLILNQNIVGRVWSFRDITEQKKAEAALKASEQNLRQVLSSTAENFYVIDRNNCVTLINESAERNLSTAWGKPVTIGTNILDAIPRERVEFFKNNIEQVFTGKKIEYEVLQSIKGLPEWLLVNYMPVNDDSGTIIGAYIVTRDITERKITEEALKRSEKQLLASIENTPNVAVQWYNKKGEVLFWNYASELIFGWKPAEALGKTLDKLIHTPEAAAEFLVTLKQIEKNGQTIGPGEFSFRCRDGSTGYCVSTIFSIPSAGGEPCFVCMDVDITERKKAEQVIKESEERYRSVIEQATDFIMITDQQGNFMDGNSNFYKTFGYTKEELLQLNINKVIDPEQLKKRPVQFDLLSKGEPVLNERRMLTKSGNIIDVEANVKMLPDGRILAIARDIRDRKKTEEQLSKERNLLRALIDNLPDYIYVKDASFNYLISNRAFVKLVGAASEAENASKNSIDLFGEAIGQINMKEDIRVIESGETVVDRDEPIVTKEGKKLWLLTTKVPLIDQENKVTGILGISKDITERKEAERIIEESEEKYRTIIEQAADGIFIADKDAFIIDVNTSGCSMLGYSKEELLKMRYTELISSESLKNNPLKLNELNSGKIIISERKIVRKDGSEILVEINVKLRIDGLYQSFIRDITDRKKAEQELEDSYAAIRRLTDYLQNIREEERAHIAREIHDELGQQLTVMKMDISWINKKLGVKDESVNTRIKELLVMLDETVKSVRRISSELRPSLLDDLGLTAAMEWQLGEFEKRFDIKTHFKFTNAEMRLPETIKTGLFRIFQESLTNVARHSKTKKVTVTLNQENSSIVLSIADDGVGFDKQKAAAKKTLGILGMRERTAMIGGTYEIISKPGKGTRVVVKIPLGESNKN